jgi:hypothetical protein
MCRTDVNTLKAVYLVPIGGEPLDTAFGYVPDLLGLWKSLTYKA